jgi:hypothetical protein
MFHQLLKEAKENVPEPPQPKIKLKLPNAAETSGHPKKITIHVGGKNSVAGSPAPATASGESDITRNETPVPVQRNPLANSTGTSATMSQLQKARSLSASVGPPSPRVMGMAAKAIPAIAKPEDAVQTTPMTRQQATPTTFQHFVPAANFQALTPNGHTPQYQLPPNQAPPPPPPPPRKSATDILEALKYRPEPISK